MSGAAILLFLGGCALGGMTRVAIANLVGAGAPGSLPWNTLVVNASGALCLGVLAGLLAPGSAPSGTALLWLALGVGFLGSYTTVSTFSLQTLALLRSGQRRAALANVGVSILLCLGMATLGAWLAPVLGVGA